MKTFDTYTKEQIKQEFKKELRYLYKDIKYALKINPHNLFKGTAREYINKYNLAIHLKDKILTKRSL